jgi:hypothetical protein
VVPDFDVPDTNRVAVVPVQAGNRQTSQTFVPVDWHLDTASVTFTYITLPTSASGTTSVWRVAPTPGDAVAEPAVHQYPIHELEGYSLLAPLTVEVESDGEQWWARLPELGLWADGATEVEAVAELKAIGGRVAAELLATPDHRLGTKLRHRKATLGRLARPL